MPNAYNKAKMTGDTHLPDVESDLPLQESMRNPAGEETSDRGQAAGRGGLKDRDAKTSNSYGHTRDSGEGGPSRR